MTAHANCTHAATKTARAACRKLAAQDAAKAAARHAEDKVLARDIDHLGLFVHPHTGEVVRSVGYEFGYVKIVGKDEKIPTGYRGLAEVGGSLHVVPVAD